MLSYHQELSLEDAVHWRVIPVDTSQSASVEAAKEELFRDAEMNASQIAGVMPTVEALVARWESLPESPQPEPSAVRCREFAFYLV